MFNDHLSSNFSFFTNACPAKMPFLLGVSTLSF